MIKRQIVCFLVSVSLLLAPFRQAQAFVPAAALVGYVVTTAGSAYRIGQAAGAVGAIAALLLSGDSSSTGTKGRVGLQIGAEPQPRQQATKTVDTILYIDGPPPDYEGGCFYSFQATHIPTNTAVNRSGPNPLCQRCTNRWSAMLSEMADPVYKGAYGVVSQCGRGADNLLHHHRFGYNIDPKVNYGKTDGGNGYVAAPRTTSDNFSDVKLGIDNGKLKFSPIVDDPDYQAKIDGTNTHPVVDSQTGGVTMYGLAPDGNKRSLKTVVNTASGTVDIIETTNNADGKTVTVLQTSLDVNTGSIVGASTVQQTGRVQVPEQQQIDTLQTATQTATNTGTGTNTSTGTGTGTGTTTGVDTTSSVKFPSDYARQGEAQAAAQSVVSKLDQINTDLNKTSEAPLPPETPDFEFFGDTFDGLLSFTLPAHISQCPTGSFDWNGTHTFDAHCDLINDHKNQLDVAMVLIWSLLAIGLVLRS